jgi:hypothetical protein
MVIQGSWLSRRDDLRGVVRERRETPWQLADLRSYYII